MFGQHTVLKNLNMNTNTGRTDTRAVWHLTPCPTTTFSWKNGELFLEKEVKPVDGISGLRLSNVSTCMHKHRSHGPPGRKYIRLNMVLFVCQVDYPAQMSPQMSDETELLKHMLSVCCQLSVFEIDWLMLPVRVAVRAQIHTRTHACHAGLLWWGWNMSHQRSKWPSLVSRWDIFKGLVQK